MKIYMRDIDLRYTRIRNVPTNCEIGEPNYFGICTGEHPNGNAFGFWVNCPDSAIIVGTKSPNIRYRINDGVEYEMRTEDDVQRFRLMMLNTQMEELLS